MLYIRHMIRTQVYLPEDLYQEVRVVAKKESKKSAQILRELLYEGLQKRKKKGTIGEALLDLASVAVKGAPPDLSTNHDKYLYEDE